MAIDVNETLVPAGRGIGPVLEVRDVFQILEQHKDRPLALEQKCLRLSAKLLDLCFADMAGNYKFGMGEAVARDILYSGKALAKLREIIKEQGGDPDCSYSSLHLADKQFELKTKESGRITVINNQNVSVIARILGSPTDKKAGIYLERKLEEEVDKGDILCTLYSSDKWRLQEAIETVKHVPIYLVE